jgi:protein-disulfide isomerase
MNSNLPGKGTPPKKDRRDAARESARLMREAQQKKDRRRKLFLRGGIGAGLVAIAVVVALVVVNSNGPAAAGPLNMASDGILLTGNGTTITAVPTTALAADATPVATDHTKLTSTANIVVYADYQCPYCGQFEATNGAAMNSWVTAGNATLEYHPISILDASSSGSKYSTRSANAAVCVANYQPSAFPAVNSALFAKQPPEGSAGLSDQDLVSLVSTAGVTDTSVTKCITGGTFKSWVGNATKRALAGPLPNSTTLTKVAGTPTVLVNGVAYTGSLTDAKAFSTFVQAQVTTAPAK